MGILTPEERERVEINPLIAICYDYILPITSELMLATHGDSITLITSDGVAICTHDSIELASYIDKRVNEGIGEGINEDYYTLYRVYIEDYLIIRDKGLYGLINLDGSIAIPAKYRHLEFEGIDSISIW